MTERGKRHIQRKADAYVIGPSALHWDGNALIIDIHEVAVPLPRPVHGRVRVIPQGLSNFVTSLDALGKHRWGPIAPCARIEVEMQAPAVRWKGHAYLDSNEGDEPIDQPFTEWDWSRSTLADGSCAVVYDVQPKQGERRVIAQRFSSSGQSSAFDAPQRVALPRSTWWIKRGIRTEQTGTASLLHSMEDTPFYARALVQTALCGERVTAVHETLNLPRLTSLPVQLMLPWRMPRKM
jgi:carotenoid 1,2-hydratase